MNGTSTVEYPRSARRATLPQESPGLERADRGRTAEFDELDRWLMFLVPPFAFSAAFFAAAIGTGQAWLMAPALVLGPMAIIFALIYLGISSDANGLS
jgi:hypothetical protein